MKIEEHRITVRDIFNGYKDAAEEGVIGYGGRLDIRPKYQREFVYNDHDRCEVIRSVKRDLPLNVIYWCKTGNDTYEVLDGQQRTISLCQYIEGDYSVDDSFFSNLPQDIRDKILNYQLFVYICDGTDSEKLDWFKIINIAGKPLTNQELLNAVYAGPWVTDAKRYFSKTVSPAYGLAGDYLTGAAIRQEYLETALKWICDRDGIDIKEYMARHQNDPTAQELWSYFRSVIDWVAAVFPKKRKEMRKQPWGIFYNKYGNRKDLNPTKLEEDIQRLMGDEDVTDKHGIYEYLLTGDEKHLSVRAFGKRDRLAAYERQHHKCALCGKELPFEDMQGDHIEPWSKGGKTVPENCQMLCIECNIKKSNH